MAIIEYQHNGGIEQVEVPQEFATAYAEFEEKEQRRVWREKKRRSREASLERLMSVGWDTPIKDYDLFDIITKKDEEKVKRPHLVGLTDYQRRVAIKFFVERKTKVEIAKEESVSKQAISTLISKIQQKVIVELVNPSTTKE